MKKENIYMKTESVNQKPNNRKNKLKQNFFIDKNDKLLYTMMKKKENPNDQYQVCKKG